MPFDLGAAPSHCLPWLFCTSFSFQWWPHQVRSKTFSSLQLSIFPSLAQWPTTTFPICRLPVFIIGVLAGLQSPDDPLPSSSLLIFPSYGPRKSESDENAEESQWAQKIDTIVCLILLGVICGEISVLFFPSNQYFNFFFQLLGVHLLLTIMLGLTKVTNILHIRNKSYPLSGWWAFRLLNGHPSVLGSMVGEALLGSLPQPWARQASYYIASFPTIMEFDVIILGCKFNGIMMAGHRQWSTLYLHWLQGWPEGHYAGIEGKTFDIWWVIGKTKWFKPRFWPGRCLLYIFPSFFLPPSWLPGQFTTCSRFLRIPGFVQHFKLP